MMIVENMELTVCLWYDYCLFGGLLH